MTTNREMLKFAEKACGIDPVENNLRGWRDDTRYWNPITNSADCAAMCAKLEINTFWWNQTKEIECVSMQDDADYMNKYSDTDAGKEAAWRYAATMVAAKIGGMK